MKKVMLIGDSIRMGYQPKVAALLAGKADVSGPDENCRFSAFTLFGLQDWVPEDDYDVIQWNNGQWDTCYMPDGRIHTPLEAYLEMQERIAGILMKKTKRLIYATTTPVCPGHFSSGAARPRKDEDIREYNRAATKLATGLGAEVNDLHAAVSEDLDRYISEDMVHLTEAGYALCASRVVGLIER